ncbi:putative enzyme with aminotransferase class-III domain protein [Fulvivirga imtechensis AK7]|uniref:Putative enzyme with aminotransferase class-III domain protein n=1 Tax=Fulvivirga imtechensis AK7 TaxID=1237149 RepID=L8JZ66_9BACT|nr:peptidoglycan DD-metalloendopeptidase family protein [Fulvivirga imtechensis]ELR73473.1 putative enzyme with aminotransferase class-III domain protein [Fulvivirga imtechensis AK7]
MSKSLEDILLHHQQEFIPVVPFDLNREQTIIFDFSASNKELDDVDIDDEQSFNSYVFGKLRERGAEAGVGGYNEDRIIYKKSAVFNTEEVRSIHLGIDIWAQAGTPVYAPLKGTIHSFKNNSASGDYGPTIILKHQLDGVDFHTLYGHLSAHSLDGLEAGQEISAGQEIATLGAYHENVHWPPHLHFQIIRDMKDYYGDYPGVASAARREEYLQQCPDPNLILNIYKLK